MIGDIYLTDILPFGRNIRMIGRALTAKNQLRELDESNGKEIVKDAVFQKTLEKLVDNPISEKIKVGEAVKVEMKDIHEAAAGATKVMLNEARSYFKKRFELEQIREKNGSLWNHFKLLAVYGAAYGWLVSTVVGWVRSGETPQSLLQGVTHQERKYSPDKIYHVDALVNAIWTDYDTVPDNEKNKIKAMRFVSPAGERPSGDDLTFQLKGENSEELALLASKVKKIFTVAAVQDYKAGKINTDFYHPRTDQAILLKALQEKSEGSNDFIEKEDLDIAEKEWKDDGDLRGLGMKYKNVKPQD
ncbi:hypothetical protein J4211_01695 [Candidatus Woesearchaeota archaeon]|nr:hypothetical protein [Candidatus Woesearchaeota archaeon]